MAGMTWLHLSDLHQRETDFDRVVVRDALLKDIQGRASINPNLAKIDFLVFSGDVAFSGQPEEYNIAREYFLIPYSKSQH
jgi:3',5'-cyclic AMP phosphodiesterase CpdA